MNELKIPRPDEESKKFFQSVLPKDSTITVRPMFGNMSAFVNGNMFTGLYGEDLFVRLSDKDSMDLLKNKGASLFEPMKGRPMKGYFFIPRSWRQQPDQVRAWVSKSLDWTAKMPAKKKAHK